MRHLRILLGFTAADKEGDQLSRGGDPPEALERTRAGRGTSGAIAARSQVARPHDSVQTRAAHLRDEPDGTLDGCPARLGATLGPLPVEVP